MGEEREMEKFGLDPPRPEVKEAAPASAAAPAPHASHHLRMAQGSMRVWWEAAD